MFLDVQQEHNNFHLINVTIFTTIKNFSYRAQLCHHLYLISELICHVSFDENIMTLHLYLSVNVSLHAVLVNHNLYFYNHTSHIYRAFLQCVFLYAS